MFILYYNVLFVSDSNAQDGLKCSLCNVLLFYYGQHPIIDVNNCKQLFYCLCYNIQMSPYFNSLRFRFIIDLSIDLYYFYKTACIRNNILLYSTNINIPELLHTFV